MAVTYQQARQHVGSPVAVHMMDGQRHFGMLQSVNQQGIVIRPQMQGGRMVAAEDVEIKVNFADQKQAVDGENVFFAAALALPFLALAALWPYYSYPYWGYGGYGGYGYGGYGYGGYGYGGYYW
jgi:hypothetical protein